MAAILSTYVSHADIEHNEVSDLPYDGIDVGWGWGMNDPGGSPDYANRGTYNYQPIYTTPTTLKNTVVDGNRIHGTKKLFHDGGSLYNLSANPGATFAGNYIYDNQHTVGLYLDEGSRYVTLTNNVVQDSGVWAFTNANANNHTDGNAFTDNWYNGGVTNVATGSPHNNTLTGNVQVSGTNWPSAAQQVINQSGPRRTTTSVSVTNPGNQTGTTGTAIGGLQVRATDSSAGQTLRYSASGLPAGLSMNASSGLITGTPATAGTFAVTVSATDTAGATGSASFTWTVTGGSTGTGGTCHVAYAKNEWSGGFTANVTVTDTGPTAVNGWTLTWSFPGDQKLTSAWNATVTQSGSGVSATNAAYNAAIAPGGNVQFGFQGTWNGNDTSPTAFALNGTPCN